MQSSCHGAGTGSSMDPPHSTEKASNGGSTGADSSSTAPYESQEASSAIAKSHSHSHSQNQPVVVVADAIYAGEEDAAALTEAHCALPQPMNTTSLLPRLFYHGEEEAAASSLHSDVSFEGLIASHDDDDLNSLYDQQCHPYNGDSSHLTSGHGEAHGGPNMGADPLLPVTPTMSASDRNKSNGGHLNPSDSVTSTSQAAAVQELVNGGNLHYNRSEGSMNNGASAQKRRSGSLLNVGERIHALQQLVSPFGKTDTASVLSEAIGYIKFLQDQVQVLSSPYMKPKVGSSIRQAQDNKSCSSNTGNTGGSVSDLRSRGLCLVPVSCTLRVASSSINIGADYWASSHHDVKYMQGSDG